MSDSKSTKIRRVLYLYNTLRDGKIINKSEAANQFGVDERSIQRDINDIRDFLGTESVNSGKTNAVLYDRIRKGYYLENSDKSVLSEGEILAVCKILLDSRAFPERQMGEILEKLINCCGAESERNALNQLVNNERFHYVEARHKTDVTEKIRQIGCAVRKGRYIEISYQRIKDRKTVNRKLIPLAIMFSEYYFYLAAFIDDKTIREDFDVLNDSFPTIYRIDRIKDLKILGEPFYIPYKNRFEEGEFRKRVQFMYGGTLRKIKFQYLGYDVDAVLDRLPTARIIDEQNGVYTITAEVFGKGIDMWIRSQGDNIRLCEG